MLLKDPTVQDGEQNTALHIACGNPSYEDISELMDLIVERFVHISYSPLSLDNTIKDLYNNIIVPKYSVKPTHCHLC